MSDDGAGADGHDGPRRSEGASRRGSALIAAGIGLSRVSGLVRERALSHFLGTSFAADAFTAAFRIPNLLQRLLGEGVLSASFIPVYSRLLAEGREEEAGRVAGAIGGLVAALAGALAVIGVVLAEPLTLLVAAGLRGRPETYELTVTLVRVLFPGAGLLVLSAWCLGVLNSHRRFFLSYVAPVMLNVAQIGVLVGAGLTLMAAEPDGALDASALASLAVWLAWGTVAGGLAQFLLQLPAVLRASRGLRPSVRTDLEGVRATLRAFVPIVSARGVVQLSGYVQVLLASFLAAGALATLRYSLILYTLPVSLFGMAVAAAELPELSRADPDERAAVAARLQAGLARIAALVAPTAVGYLVAGDLVTGALFQTGEFDRLDTIAVWVVLCGYALGLLATTSSRLLQSALYGSGDPRTPSRAAVARVLVSATLGALLMLQADRMAVTGAGLRLIGELPALGPLPTALRDAAGAEGVIRLGAAGLSLASGVAAWLEYGLLRRAVTRRIGRTTLGGGQLRPILLASLIAALVPMALRPLAAPAHPFVAGAGIVAAMGAVYVVAASKLGIPEVRAVLRQARRRIARR